jgi:hypothetical protein
MERLASLALVLHSGDASGRGGRGSGPDGPLGKNDGKPQRLLASKLKRIDTAMELLIIVALLALSVALGAAGTRAILGIMFSIMLRARPAHAYAGSFDRRATARAA